VLSNASRIQIPEVFTALNKLDQNILKLDAGTGGMLDLINNPGEPVDMGTLVANLKKFNGNLVIQSMFLRGNFKGHVVDNTTEAEVNAWIGHLLEIKPKMVMIYPIARATPLHNLEKIGAEELEAIAERVKGVGLTVGVY
jgi:wyosine [tRNA(Phe)-imidazoG37] synthetase (radical SAM superfamily)